MQEPAGREPSVAAVLQPRRRRSRAVLVLVAIACVLAGRGLGWFGGGGEAAPATSPPAGPEPHEVVVAPVVVPLDPAPTPVGEPASVATASVATAPAAPASESAATMPAPMPAPPAAAGIDSDRFASLLSLVAARQQQGELGGALAALQRALVLPLDATQRETVQARADEVRAALDRACEQIANAVGTGDVLAAHSSAQKLLAEGAELARPALAASLHCAAESLDRVPERGAMPWPIAAPLARDRVVRVRLAAGPATGRVVDGRSDQVTLRVETEHGVTFPTLAVTVCEPVDASAAEAVELALAALQAGEPLLARLWLCCANQRGDTVSPRLRRLQEILH